ncbi:DUF3987 domain-containing protein [Acaryochloris sp. IP29b_bin.148]|uniref:DUF3987 domain-containing protein n=1 Tax=Acaryochloris sp. IP29b_bin.148 TaxID=2969218 RepID=UPI00261FFE44|nr:DUF3987 domain-containing protein [Acaryochloris sp. IP29b_bin.148]
MAAKCNSSKESGQQFQGITQLPSNWRYTPIGDKKNPISRNWQNTPLTAQELLEEYNDDSRFKAIGLLTGKPSGGILAIDHDGYSCDLLIEELSHQKLDSALPKTVGFTSGKPGRYQLLYFIREERWPDIKSRVIKTGFENDSGKPEQLEFRWNGRQSVIIGVHPETGSYEWRPGQSPHEVEVAECPEWILKEIIHFDAESSNGREDYTEEDRERALSYLAAIPPQDDYDVWLKVGMALKSVDEDLLDEWNKWSSLADNYEPGVCEEKWDSFNGEGITIATLGHLAKQNGWKGKSPHESQPGDELEHTSQQQESFDDDPQSVEELNTLISEGNASPPQLFSEQLSKPLANLASSLGLPVEAFIVGILPILASRLKAGTQLAIDPVTDYYAKPILWAGLVGESGTLKTPILQGLIKPLESIQKEEFDSFKAMKALYEIKEQEWNLLTKNEKKGKSKPTPPVVKDIYFSDFTIEAIADSNSKYPDDGYLVHTDELAAFFKSMDAYRNGKGSDRQRWLALYGGGALKVNRKTSDPIFLHQTSISIVGGIQPSVLEKQVLQDSTSEDGLWARFIWARLPMTTPPGISDRPRINISPLLEGLYRDLNKSEAKTYHLSAEAKPLWNQWNAEIGQLIQQEPSGILRAAYPKLKEIAARIALIVHITNSTLDNSPPVDAIGGDILNDAIHFTKWLMGQTRMLYCEIGTSNNPQVTRILKFVNRYKGCDWVDARTVTQWSGRPRPKAPEAREFMAQLVGLGHAIDNGEPVDSPKFKIQIPEISQQANKIYKSLSE